MIANYFAHPGLLWGLLLIPGGWLWHVLNRKFKTINQKGLDKFIDPNLLPHLLLQRASSNKRNYNGLLYTLLVFCLILALANPRWSYKDLDAYQPTASMVILLDLSNTMNATDVSPSRIVRARQNIEDLINLSKGLKIGLIGFAGYPHLISPITDDIQTIKTFIPALDTDLTNVQGNSLARALSMAADLLGNEPGDKKSILLISDGNLASDDFSHELKTLTAHNIQVHVIGVGTTAGAPFKTKNGSLQKSQGKIVISKLNADLLKEIAKQGHGIYTEAGSTDLGIRAILLKAEQKQEDHIVAGKVRQWDERYYLFIIPAAAILLYLMRQRVLYMFIVAFCATVIYSPEVKAYEVQNMFKNSEQIGQQYYTSGNFKEAANTFKDPYHKGVALYRDGQYAQAEQAFMQVQRPAVKTDALYNAGNAQMQQRKWRAAIKSYEDVLKIAPDNFAAQHNLEIARKMLAQNADEGQSDSDCECKNKDKQSKEGKSDSVKNKNDSQEDSSNAEQKQSQESEKQQQKQQQAQQQDQDAAQKDDQEDQQGQDQDANESQESKAKHQELNMAQLSEEDARVEQWLQRIDSDIKVFLRNKFYVEDMLGAQ